MRSADLETTEQFAWKSVISDAVNNKGSNYELFWWRICH